MTKIKAILNHLINGTFLKRISENKKHQLFREYDAFMKSDQEYIIKMLSSSIHILLFKKANLSRELYCYGFEEAEMQFLKKYLKNDDVVFDIGANVGLFTLICSEFVGNSGTIHAFEPSPQTFNWLEQNVNSNKLKNVILNQLAVSDKDGTIGFHLSEEGYDAFNSIVKPSKGSNYISQTVNCLTLDSYVEKHQLQGKIQIIKIDVEGFEISLLSGASRILSAENAPDLVVEFTESNAENAGFTCAQLYAKIVGFGYELFHYNAETNSLIPEPEAMSYVKYKNLVATKNIEKIVERLA
jgi:FkbM family methyltransferase